MNESTMTIHELRDRVHTIRTAMVTTVDERGTLSSRPLTVQRISSDGDVAFIVDRDADWLPTGTEPANVALVDEGHTWLSIAGRATTNDDRQLLEALWDKFTDIYFPEGKDQGTAIVFEVKADRWEYWTAPNMVAKLVSFAKAAITATTPDLGTSGEIET